MKEFKVSAIGRAELVEVIRGNLESDQASGVPLEGSAQMLAHWVVGLLENRNTLEFLTKGGDSPAYTDQEHKVKRLADAACDLLRRSENREGSAERKLEAMLNNFDPNWSTR